MGKVNKHVKQKFQVVIPAASSDWHLYKLSIGVCGVVAHLSYRLDVTGGVSGSIDVKIIDGPYASQGELLSTIDVDTIPDEDVIVYDAAVALTAHATDAQQTNVVGESSFSAIYDLRGNPGYSFEESAVFLAVKNTSTTEGTLNICVRAVDVGV